MKGMATDFSFIILTYNESIHLPRLLKSVKGLNAPIYIVDSFSTDDTLAVAASYGCEILQNKFENHPKQWDYALRTCNINTKWVIGLDADQIVTAKLANKLANFKDENLPQNINAIYFNRHNYFQGKRLKYGGYRNFVMLKMFRYGLGHSDLSENMDHRFVCPGQALVWKDGVLVEDNLKERDINFWIRKHLGYSSQVAKEEWERRNGKRKSNVKGNLFGTINEQKLFLKNIWWRLPLFVRPRLYFFYRFFIRLGFMECRQGRLFHFLHSYWFRMLVDHKLSILLKLNNEDIDN
jgi:glycosyltransferase involved in cell wall biosynthesis